jgi:hypothetical protein
LGYEEGKNAMIQQSITEEVKTPPQVTAKEIVNDTKTDSQPPVQAAAADTKPQESKPNPDLKRFQALARRERQLVQMQAELKAREARMQEVERRLQEMEERSKTYRVNPLEALKDYGHDYKSVTDYVLNEGKMPPERLVGQVEEKLSKEIEALKAERQKELEEKKQQAEAESARIRKDFEQNCFDYVEQNAQTYELISLNQAQGLLPAVIEEHYYKTQEKDDLGNVVGPGKILSFKEAADLVEQHLEKQIEANVASKKYQAKVKPQPQGETTQAQESKTPKTITNQMSSSAAASMLPAQTEADRMRRAMEKLG